MMMISKQTLGSLRQQQKKQQMQKRVNEIATVSPPPTLESRQQAAFSWVHFYLVKIWDSLIARSKTLTTSADYSAYFVVV